MYITLTLCKSGFHITVEISARQDSLLHLVGPMCICFFDGFSASTYCNVSVYSMNKRGLHVKVLI